MMGAGKYHRPRRHHPRTCHGSRCGRWHDGIDVGGGGQHHRPGTGALAKELFAFLVLAVPALPPSLLEWINKTGLRVDLFASTFLLAFLVL